MPVELREETRGVLKWCVSNLGKLRTFEENCRVFDQINQFQSTGGNFAAGVLLRHELSGYLVAKGLLRSTPALDRTPTEAKVLDDSIDRYLSAHARTGGYDTSLLLELVSLLNARPTSWRTGRISIRGGIDSEEVVMPRAGEAKQQASRIAKAASTCRDLENDLGQAIFNYVVLLNAHPFPDGNGRLARVLLNMELRRLGAPPGCYVPFYLAFDKAVGGYEVRLREAEMLGRWDPIMLFICYVINLSMNLLPSDCSALHDWKSP